MTVFVDGRLECVCVCVYIYKTRANVSQRFYELRTPLLTEPVVVHLHAFIGERFGQLFGSLPFIVCGNFFRRLYNVLKLKTTPLCKSLWRDTPLHAIQQQLYTHVGMFSFVCKCNECVQMYKIYTILTL